MENDSKDFESLIKRIALANIIFITILTALSCFFLIAYDFPLLKESAKIDIIKVFFSNIRFSVSALAYVNLPVILLLFLFPILNASKVSSFFISIFKSYYNLSFLLIFYIQFTYHVLHSIFLRNIQTDSLVSRALHILASAARGDSMTILLVTLLSAFVTAMLFFIFFTKHILPTENYAISDRKISILFLILVLLLCVMVAKGKIHDFLSFENSHVTENEQLNEFAVNAALHKVVFDIKNFNPAELQKYTYSFQKAKKLPKIFEKDILGRVSGISSELEKLTENMEVHINKHTYKAIENIDPGSTENSFSKVKKSN
ncbi:MAG: hypothetical protein LBR69_04025 [Endomicrobium sp.]|jgi:hypothetical protein|nr:hypothetical protein [Endomicrobium sp.]